MQFLCGMANIPHTTHKFKMKGKKSARVLAIPGEKLVNNFGTTSHRSLLLSKSFVLHSLGEKELYIENFDTAFHEESHSKGQSTYTHCEIKTISKLNACVYTLRWELPLLRHIYDMNAAHVSGLI